MSGLLGASKSLVATVDGQALRKKKSTGRMPWRANHHPDPSWNTEGRWYWTLRPRKRIYIEFMSNLQRRYWKFRIFFPGWNKSIFGSCHLFSHCIGYKHWFPSITSFILEGQTGWKMSRTPTESAAKSFHHPTGTRSSMTFAEKKDGIFAVSLRWWLRWITSRTTEIYRWWCDSDDIFLYL